MTSIINVNDMVEENGKTIRENNLEKKHQFEIDELVECKISHYDGSTAFKGTARLYVFKQYRDCDGTPLYMLSTMSHKFVKDMFIQNGTFEEYNSDRATKIARFYGHVFSGHSEDDLHRVSEKQVEEMKEDYPVWWNKN